MGSLPYIRAQNAIRMLDFDFLKLLGHVRTIFDMLVTSKIIFHRLSSKDIFSNVVKKCHFGRILPYIAYVRLF